MKDLYCLRPSQIVMYTTAICADCRRAKAFFEAKGISFPQIGIEGDEQATQFVRDLNHGYHSVPTIVFPDGAVMLEPSWDDLRRKFQR